MGTLIFYNAILIFSTVFVFFQEKTKNINMKSLSFLVVFLILSLPAAFRYNIGSDYWSYLLLFEDYKRGVDSGFEPGMQAIYFAVRFFDLDNQFVFIISSCLIYIIYLFSLPERNAFIYHFSYMSFCYLSSFNLIRSALAFSFILLAIKLIINHKSKALLMAAILFSLLFHKSSLFILIFILVLYFALAVDLHESYKVNLCCLVFILIYFCFRYEISNSIFNGELIEALGYGYYFDNAFFKFVELNSGLGLLVKILPVVLLIVFSCRMKFSNPVNGNVIMVSGYFFIIASIMMGTIEIFSRVQRLFVFGIMYCGVGINYLSNSLLRKILLSLFIFNCILFFNYDIIMFKSDKCEGSRINPYISIFNTVDDKSWSGIEHIDCMGK